MVGVQCKSCGHRALYPPPPPKFDYEIITQLSQSSLTCSQCGKSEFSILSFTGDLGDRWLESGPSTPGTPPLIEGGSQG